MLEKIKLYLKIDQEVENDLINDFIEWGKAFIKEKTGKDFSENDYNICMQLASAINHTLNNRFH